MQQSVKKNHYIDIIFVLALFFLFAFSSTTLILLGSHIYQNTASLMEKHYDERTISSYLTEKVRQNDTLHAIEIREIDGVSVLCIHCKINDTAYTTYLYEYQHELYELFTRSDLAFDFTYGQAIYEIQNLTFQLETSHLLTIHYTNQANQTKELTLSLHCEQSVPVSE